MPGFRPLNGCFPGRFRSGLSGGPARSLCSSPGCRFSALRGLPAALRGGGSGVILRQFPSGDWVVAAGDFAVLHGLRGGAVCSGFSFPGKFVPGSMLVDELAGAARSVPALSAFSALSWPTLFSPVAAGCLRRLFAACRAF